MAKSTKTPPSHEAMSQFAIDGDELIVGDVPLSRLAARIGGTPFYAYDRTLLTARVAQLRQALPKDLSLHYAIKANPMPAVVQHFSSLVDGLDVASVAEMHVALDTGCQPEHISFAGPGKTPGELKSAVAAGIVVNAESETEVDRLLSAGEELGIAPRIAVRVNPDFELKASGMKMGGGPKQFGLDAERVPQLLSRLKDSSARLEGLHIYSGSQNLRADAIEDAQRKTFDLAYRLVDQTGVSLRFLNIGGGLGIPYFPGDRRLDLDIVGEHLEEMMIEARQRLPDTEIVLELGRYLVGEAGIYVCSVVDRKRSRDQVFLITDGGLHHHLAVSGNFGQVIRKNYPVAIGNRMKGEQVEVATVVGPLCTPLDLLADRMALPRAEVGDLVVVYQSGAYGPSASPAAFLSHPAAKEVLV